MKRLCFLLVFLLTSAVLAQGGSVDRARNLAQRLSQSQELPGNLRLRFQILVREMKYLAGDHQPDDVLNFFSDTRVMVWNRGVSPPVEQNMLALEQEMVKLSQARGILLDLPPVGHAPRGQSRLLSTERVTANGLSQLVLRTEQVATEILPVSDSRELLVLRDSLTRLRLDLQDGRVVSDNVRALLGARVRFLAGDAQTIRDQRLHDGLATLGEALRGRFTPTVLRQSRGQELTL